MVKCVVILDDNALKHWVQAKTTSLLYEIYTEIWFVSLYFVILINDLVFKVYSIRKI